MQPRSGRPVYLRPTVVSDRAAGGLVVANFADSEVSAERVVIAAWPMLIGRGLVPSVLSIVTYEPLNRSEFAAR
jgi:hypothetical protein